MAKQILTCPSCQKFTIQDICTDCKTKTLTCKPAKYSPEDKYAKYRRQAIQEELEKKEKLQ